MHDQRFIFVLSYRKKSQVVQGNCNWIEDVIPKMPYDSISSSSVRSAQSLKVDSRPPWSSNIKANKGLLHSDIIMRTDCLL